MRYRDRQGREYDFGTEQEQVLDYLYHTPIGRYLLKILIQPPISKVGGWILNRRLSCLAIAPFVKKNHIHLEEYEKSCVRDYCSYNDFFMRRIQLVNRPVDMHPNHLISVCDSKLSVYPISETGTYSIKHTNYTIHTLLRSRSLAKQFEGGTLLLFRLTVDDYHRYCYPDDAIKSKNYCIPGVFHTVNPLANDVYPIYKENSREFTLLRTKHFGSVIMMEVGALMVGRIVNYEEASTVHRGDEKGRFEFGGSTIILCLQKKRVKIDEDILANSSIGIETAVKYGERIGVKSSVEPIE